MVNNFGNLLATVAGEQNSSCQALVKFAYNMHYECKALQVLNIFGYRLPYKNNDDAIEMRWDAYSSSIQITDWEA